ncbi:MAG: hypothetical protein K2Q22_08555, partial [Cytophagales bacterium]|nr:hypothetical protein [Cytophagales bacterium]
MRKLCNVIICLMLFLGQALASEYRWTSKLDGQVVAGSQLDLSDPLAKLEPNHSVSYKWAVMFQYTRENNSDIGVSNALAAPWSYTVNYTISYLNDFGMVMKSENNVLTINYSSNGKSAYTDARIHSDLTVLPTKPYSRSKVTVNSIATSGTVPYADIRLELTLIADEAPQIPSGNTPPDLYLFDNSNLLAWTYVKGVIEYELEWVAIDYYATNSTGVTDFFSLKEPVRVSTDQQFYIPNFIYPNAMVYVRVRGVSYYPNGTPKYTGWSTQSIVINLRGSGNVGIEEGRNWQMTTTFAEGGKNKKLVSYMD